MIFLFIVLIVLILLSFPISLSIGFATALAFLESHLPLYMAAQRMFDSINSYMLLSVPLFMFAGNLMDQGGLSKRIVRLAEDVVGHMRGGLTISAILSSMLFAGVSGSAAADTAAIGSILIPSMKKHGYDKKFAAGVVASSVILIIISAATVFSWYPSMNSVQVMLEKLFLGFAGNKIVLILMVNLFLLVMGTFVETTASLVLFAPVAAPILSQAGINPITNGVMIVTNLAIGMLAPPLGICLIVSSAIAQSDIVSLSKTVFPFLAVMIADLVIIAFFEPITTILL